MVTTAKEKPRFRVAGPSRESRLRRTALLTTRGIYKEQMKNLERGTAGPGSKTQQSEQAIQENGLSALEPGRSPHGGSNKKPLCRTSGARISFSFPTVPPSAARSTRGGWFYGGLTS